MPPGLGRLLMTAFAGSDHDDHGGSERDHHAAVDGHGAGGKHDLQHAKDHDGDAVKSTSTDTGDSDNAGSKLAEMTPEKILRRMHPLMQQFLATVPDLKQAWVKHIDDALQENAHKSLDAQGKVYKSMQDKVHEMNREIDANPGYISRITAMVTGQPQVGASPFFLPPPPGCKDARCRRQTPRSRVSCFL
eukprot:gb/GFBE01035286.1/.p1 GENE.gb/GFBE01035286.1/~~gb/GFBE01035286.1/.p1  ORF type:complete len:190 (+),score=36.24 gb/GFBE01035286.1/:1-570(+)